MEKSNLLDNIFHPQSIAILGASVNPASKGYDYLKGLIELGYRGKIYPVNPGTREIIGIKTYYHVKDIPGNIDYVISCIPAKSVIELIEECALKGAKTIQLYTSGFSETGQGEGIALEKKLIQKARNAGLRVVGPNCIGLHYPKWGLAFGRARFTKKGGPVGGVIQSGGHAWHLACTGSIRGLGFSKIISFGNGCDLDESDFLEYLAEDKDTKIIVAYIEGIKNSLKFVEAVRKTTRKKPLIMLKSGRTCAGKRAVASHTGSFAGSEMIWKAFFRQTCTIRAYNLDELIDLTLPFVTFPNLKSGNVGIVGAGGGASVQAADDCENYGLKVPQLPKNIKEQLVKFIPLEGSGLENPIDTAEIWKPENFVKTLELVASWDKIDQIFVHTVVELTAQWQGQNIFDGIIDSIIKIKDTIGKPVTVILQSYGTRLAAEKLFEIQKKFAYYKIPVYPSVERAARAISQFINYNCYNT